MSTRNRRYHCRGKAAVELKTRMHRAQLRRPELGRHLTSRVRPTEKDNPDPTPNHLVQIHHRGPADSHARG